MLECVQKTGSCIKIQVEANGLVLGEYLDGGFTNSVVLRVKKRCRIDRKVVIRSVDTCQRNYRITKNEFVFN